LEFHDRCSAAAATAVDAKSRRRSRLLFGRSIQLSVIFFLISVHPTHFPPLAAHQHVRRRRLVGGGGDGRRGRDRRGGGGSTHCHFAVNRDAHRGRKTKRQGREFTVSRQSDKTIFGNKRANGL